MTRKNAFWQEQERQPNWLDSWWALAGLAVILVVLTAFSPKPAGAKQAESQTVPMGWVKVTCPKKDVKEHSLFYRCNLIRPEAVKFSWTSRRTVGVNATVKCPGYTPIDDVDLHAAPSASYTVNRSLHPYMYAMMHASPKCTFYIIMAPESTKSWGIRITSVLMRQRPKGQ